MFTRRSFLSRHALGGAAALLSPMVGGFLREANGQTTTRKLALFYVFGTGFHPDWEFVPNEFKAQSPGLSGPKDFTWPTAFAPLEKLRQRVLLVDGLKNNTKTESHGSGFAALSCVSDAAAPFDQRPKVAAGITIDQYVAEHLGKGTSFPSVRFGLRSFNWTPTRATVFAFGKDKPAEHIQDPILYHRTLFGKIVGGASPVQSKTDTLILDTIRADIRRVQGQLAGPEREKLGLYLGSIEELEKRQTAALKCGGVPAAPADMGQYKSCHKSSCVGPRIPEDALESMMNMSLIAVLCGMTNVICVADGAPGAHGGQTRFRRIHMGTQFESQGAVQQPDHDGESTGKPKRQIVRRYQTGVLAQVANTLNGAKVGDKTLFDQTTMLFMSENADDHHAPRKRWPLLLIGNAGGKLKVDGRYLHYGDRALADLFSTMATALGRPTSDFGKGGATPIQGPLTEILA